MKLTVKTLKGSHFEIKIMAVKKNIKDVQGKDNYPCRQQLLIHNGKVLKDETTLRDCNVSEDGFLVVMLSKVIFVGLFCSLWLEICTNLASTPMPVYLLVTGMTNYFHSLETFHLQTAPALTPAPVPSSITPVQTHSPTGTRTNDQAASNIVASDNREQTIQHILDIGGGNWDRETIIGALRAAYNNPERAVDYLYSGIPHTEELAVPVSQESLSGGGSGGEGGLGSLDFLRNNQQFQALRSMVQSNPQIIHPVLQEVGKQNPQLLRALG
ncbi:hypothetical protein QQ045_007579 [Rhodiola kirilowii]